MNFNNSYQQTLTVSMALFKQEETLFLVAANGG